ncbi:MAG: DNA-directed RNA polymerase subunit alpha [Candidatus Niyogibacteria bacterium CG10_big_fil_rev_8_21_14_0_10_46_36]|uniref:DNA-directed RNA polymerase subunit alpha n=1 Tax=Candidatus Niyogibacteria bacterium CG10_big_fil_rev_8_21_14_0_10_46_36 TaxID=1974726 RepID=A0A2H0TEA9_9BACT|nr:MAG: DNA-directed RNA polymerase subunit alpha [Candidatus Niyogibacteria bacterium CG10_big_fil_rev_8_21_14_0_10_46_36]
MDKSIILPSKPRVISEEKMTGVYEIDGLYPGYGHTFGNALRRILLSSLPGAAATEVKIEGVKHMFSTIDGVKEDVVTILLNLKQLRVKAHSDEPQKLTLQVKGAKEITAKDFKVPTQLELANPELMIATLTDKESSISMEVTVEKGLGYRAHDAAQQKKKMDIGSMMLDAVFTPIRRVRYEVENMRVGDRTDFNRLRITIETDGTLTPREALEKSITIMIEQLKAIIGFVEEEETPIIEEKIDSKEEDKDEGAGQEGDLSDVLKVRIEELNFSGRVLNALSHAGIRTVGGLVKKTPEDLMKLEGIGEKAVEDIKQVLDGMGLTLRE